MNTKTHNYLNSVTTLPLGYPVTLEHLHSLGVSDDLAGYYARSGWLSRIAQGVYARPGPLNLYASLRILERKLSGCHIGGRTALAWHGIQHFVRTESPLELFGWNSGQIPDWFSNIFPATFRRKRLFEETPENLVGVSRFGDGENAPIASDPERALLEMLSEVGVRQSLSEARSVMEGAYGMREEVLLLLLKKCTNVKTVRLCLLLSRELRLPFAEALFSANLPKKGNGAWITSTPEGWLILK